MHRVSKRLLPASAALALAVALTACASDDGVSLSAGAKPGGITANTPLPNGDQGPGSDNGSGDGVASNGDSGNGDSGNGASGNDSGSGSQPKTFLAVSGGLTPRNGTVTVNALGTSAGTTLATAAPAGLLSGPLAASGNLLPAGLLDTVGATVNAAAGESGGVLGLGLTGPLGLNANGSANASSTSAGAQGNAGLLGADVVKGVSNVLNATPLGSATGALNGATGNNGLISGTIAGQPVLSADRPLLGVSAASPAQNTGSLLSAGVASGGNLVSLGTPLPGANTLLSGTGNVLGGVTGAAGGVSGSAPAAGNTLSGLTNAISGVADTVGGIAGGTPLGTLLPH